MGGSGSPEAAPDEPEARRQKATGAWSGYLIFAMCLLVLGVFDAQAAYQHQWGRFAGTTVFALAFVIVPTGGVKWLRRSLRRPKEPAARRPSGR
jgi:protein-S-isoprenylcysteine O-methyltransferase Ste14